MVKYFTFGFLCKISTRKFRPLNGDGIAFFILYIGKSENSYINISSVLLSVVNFCYPNNSSDPRAKREPFQISEVIRVCSVHLPLKFRRQSCINSPNVMKFKKSWQTMQVNLFDHLQMILLVSFY